MACASIKPDVDDDAEDAEDASDEDDDVEDSSTDATAASLNVVDRNTQTNATTHRAVHNNAHPCRRLRRRNGDGMVSSRAVVSDASVAFLDDDVD